MYCFPRSPSGVANQLTLGAGAFVSKNSQSAGGFISLASTLFGNSLFASPVKPETYGFSGGGNLSVFISNAGNLAALNSGTSTTWAGEIAVGAGGTVQFSYNKSTGIWSLSGGFGPGVGASFTVTQTATKGKGACKG